MALAPVASSVTRNLAAAAILVMVSGGAQNLLTGSAQLSTTGNVSGFIIVRHNGQKAGVAFDSRNVNGFIIAFDNTNGTAARISVNAVSAPEVNIPVVVCDDFGQSRDKRCRLSF